MLPKDILQYARKFSPAEIEKAIIDAIQLVGKTIVGHVPTASVWETLRTEVRHNLNIPSTLPTVGTTATSIPMWQTYTTTAANQTLPAGWTFQS